MQRPHPAEQRHLDSKGYRWDETIEVKEPIGATVPESRLQELAGFRRTVEDLTVGDEGRIGRVHFDTVGVLQKWLALSMVDFA